MNTEVADLAPGTRARNLRWINRFASLGERFFTRLPAAGLPDPHWIATSDACAAELGLAPGWNDAAALQAFSGNAPLPGMQPLASVYSGHQFGVWAGQLGDGRALWLGEIDAPDGPRELQLKGGGMTPYSRMGDGRAVLRSTIREFLCSEAMAALGIPTTRALCMTGSALPVRRETIETAAIVTRVAPSFLRFGHFEHFTHTQPDKDALRMLADFVIRHHCPALLTGATPDETTYLALLAEVARRTAVMIAGWQSVGFCHGVMNTDNMSILGLTIDYGPFGFLDAFEPGHICNHSDHNGRYSYARQPNAAFWNLHALAMALSPLVGDPDAAIDALDVFKSTFAESLAQRLSDKLGLRTRQPGDSELADALLQRMAADRADMTITFRRLSTFSTADHADNATVRDLFIDREAFDAWGSRYAARLRDEQSDDAERATRMNRVNPKYVLRNHLAEEAIQAARQGDFSVTNRLMQILSHPFDEQPEHAAHAGFPPDWAKQLEVSCSS